MATTPHIGTTTMWAGIWGIAVFAYKSNLLYRAPGVRGRAVAACATKHADAMGADEATGDDEEESDIAEDVQIDGPR